MVKEGYIFSCVPLALGAAALVFRWDWVGAILLLVGVFVLYFFRDPERLVPTDRDVVVAPADGRVMEVLEEPLGERPGQRISIFLAIWNVHVNRAPMAGRIRVVDYRRGRFYAAMRSRASSENEQNVFYLETVRGEIVFKQIAGWIARRVVAWKKEGAEVAAGERIGMIRFGSRMDVWLPLEAEIVAKPGQHVAGGTSIIARWK
jgi:phosphatidylserine decarboxylase